MSFNDKKSEAVPSKGSDRVGVEVAEAVDERTAVHTPEPSTDLEKQRQEIIEEQKDGLPAPIEIPDGGIMAWATVFGAWCILFATFGMTNAFGVYQDYYVRVFLTNYTPSDIGWIGSVQLFFQFSMGIVSGKLFDAGHFYPMMIGASALYVFCYYMLSLAHEGQYYQVFLAQGIGAGIALGFLFLPAVGVIAHHFRRRRSFAMGIVVSGSSCGGLVFPVMLNRIIERQGFHAATRGVSYLVTGLMVLAILSMRTRLPPRGKMPVPAGAAPPPKPDVVGFLKDAKYMFAIGGAFFNILGIFVPIFYMQLYAINHGVNNNLAFYTITILNAASVIGRILPNFISDIWGPYNTIIVTTLACAIISISMLAAKDAGGIVAISVLYGLFSGAYVSLISPLFASLASSISEIGIRLGLAFTVCSVAALAGTPIAGALLTDELLWKRPIAFGAACMFFAFILLVCGRMITARAKGTWKV